MSRKSIYSFPVGTEFALFSVLNPLSTYPYFNFQKRTHYLSSSSLLYKYKPSTTTTINHLFNNTFQKRLHTSVPAFSQATATWFFIKGSSGVVGILSSKTKLAIKFHTEYSHQFYTLVETLDIAIYPFHPFSSIRGIRYLRIFVISSDSTQHITMVWKARHDYLNTPFLRHFIVRTFTYIFNPHP